MRRHCKSGSPSQPCPKLTIASSGLLKVRYGNLDNLLDGGNKGQTILWRDESSSSCLRCTRYNAHLQPGETAIAISQRPKKRLLARGTGVVQRTMCMLSNNPVCRIGGTFFVYKFSQYARIESARMPFARIVGRNCRDVEATVHTRDGAIAKEGQRFSFLPHFFIGRTGCAYSQ